MLSSWRTAKQAAFEFQRFFFPPSSRTAGLSASLWGSHVFFVHLACKYGVCEAGLQGIYMFFFFFLKPCAGLSHIHGNQPLQSPCPGWVKLNKTHKTESTWDQLLWCPWITSKEKCGITWLEKTHDLKPQRNSYIQSHLLWNSPLVWGLLVAGVQCTANGWLLP